MSVKIVLGSLFASGEKYMAHQCNCVTTRAAHLAKDVFSLYPYADIYSTRTRRKIEDIPEEEKTAEETTETTAEAENAVEPQDPNQP